MNPFELLKNMDKIKSVNLETVCGITSKIPENEMPEVAFAGKSNVGKSSLINSLINRKAYARTSQTPGKTQTINYYRINEGVTPEEVEEREFAPDCYLVDLPGYGYAGVSVSEKAKWGPMVEGYLKNSGMLRRVFLLVDIRHDPSKNDIMMHDWILKNGFEPVIIATKSDKIKRSQIQKSISKIRSVLKVPGKTPVVAFSALSKDGLLDVWELMKDAVK